MIRFSILLIAPIFFVVALHSSLGAEPQEKALNVDDLKHRPVIGTIGVPLGQAVEVDATIVAGNKRSKADAGLYLLQVESVNGKKLEKPVTLHFYVHSVSDAKLASNDFALFELKNGRKASQLSSDQIAELAKGYVGSTVRLVVYESGGFSGIPKGLPSDFPDWQDSAFHFSTYLGVLKQRQ